MYGDVFGNRAQESALPGDTNDPETPAYQWQPALDLSRRAPKYGMNSVVLTLHQPSAILNELRACSKPRSKRTSLCTYGQAMYGYCVASAGENHFVIVVRCRSVVFAFFKLRDTRRTPVTFCACIYGARKCKLFCYGVQHEALA